MRMIELGGKEYPIYCDMAVLEAVQEEYGTVNEFEKKLIGIKGYKTQKVNGEEKNVPIYTDPSVKAIRIAAFHMINEAIDVENEERHEQTPHVSMAEIKRAKQNAGMMNRIMAVIHEEFMECFESKNGETGQGETEEAKKEAV